MAENFMVVKFYSSSLNCMDESCQDLILWKPSFVLNLVVVYTRFASSLRILILQFCH